MRNLPLGLYMPPPPPPPPPGKCYVVASQKSLVKCMESLTQKLHPGVVVNFLKVGANGSSLPGNEATPMEIDDIGTACGWCGVLWLL